MMGRSGGGFSGGRSGGGFGGGRTGGGRSFGGRSGGSFGGNRPSGFGSRPHGGFYGGGFYRGFRPAPPIYPMGGRRRGSSGCLPTVIVLLVFVAILGVVFSAARSQNRSEIRNTTQRTPLSGQVHKTEWCRDDIGWITEKPVLIEGLEEFYKETGVQPYILFVPYSDAYWRNGSINGDAAQSYLEQVYDRTFTDEAHFLFAYFECERDSKKEMEGQFQYLSGYAADTVMDNEAKSIFWGYFTSYYNDTSYTIEEMLSNTFADTARSIMSTPTNGWDFAKVAVVVLGVAAVAGGIVIVVRTVAKRRKEKEEYTKTILETPLETFGAENDTADLEKKYQDKP